MRGLDRFIKSERGVLVRLIDELTLYENDPVLSELKDVLGRNSMKTLTYSILRECLPVVGLTDKGKVLGRILGAGIRSKDKRLMTRVLSRTTTDEEFCTKFFNFLLKYEGEGVIK